MKQIFIGAILALAAASAFASGQTQFGQTNSQSQSQSTSLAGAAASNNSQGNGVNSVTIDSVTPDNITIKNTPSVNGPNLTTSNDTCMGSTSGSVNIAGLGIGGGSTWVDTNCKRLKNARELWNMGMKAASLALLCGDADNKDALEMTGYTCPTKKADKPAASASATSTRKPNMVMDGFGQPWKDSSGANVTASTN